MICFKRRLTFGVYVNGVCQLMLSCPLYKNPFKICENTGTGINLTFY